MKMYRFCFVRLALIYVALSLLQACGHHPRSEYTEHEVVEVEKLSFNTFCNYTAARESYAAAFEGKDICSKREYSTSMAPIIATAAGIAVDQLLKYGSAKIKEEAQKHAADFRGSIFINDFWAGDTIQYPAIRITRKAMKKGKINDGKNNDPCYELFLGLYADRKNKVIWVKPITFKTSCTKATVSKKGEVSTATEVLFDSAWVDTEDKFHKQNLLTFTPVSIGDYQLENPTSFSWYTSGRTGSSLFRKSDLSVGVMPLVPKPPKPTTDSETGGLLWVKVVVTEIDKSKIKTIYSGLAEAVEKNRDKVVDGLKDLVPKDPKTPTVDRSKERH